MRGENGACGQLSLVVIIMAWESNFVCALVHVVTWVWACVGRWVYVLLPPGKLLLMQTEELCKGN